MADMDIEIHRIEIEAYGAVLKAFIAQSEDLSWAKEGLITELRKELRVSDTEHREILGKVHLDDKVKSIRERRNSYTDQHLKATNPSLSYPSLVSCESNKRQKVATPLLSSPMYHLRAPPSSVPVPMPMSSSPKHVTCTQPSSAPARMNVSCSKHPLRAQPSSIPVAIPLSFSKHLPHGQPKASVMPSPLTVQSRESQVNNETAIFSQHTHSQSHMVPLSQGKQIISSSRLRAPAKPQAPKKDYINSGSEVLKVVSDIIEIRDTDKLIKEVQKICGVQPNHSQLTRATLVLREHERALMEAIRKIAAISDNDNTPLGIQNQKEECNEAQQMDIEGFYYDNNYNGNYKLNHSGRSAVEPYAVFNGEAFANTCYASII